LIKNVINPQDLELKKLDQMYSERKLININGLDEEQIDKLDGHKRLKEEIFDNFFETHHRLKNDLLDNFDARNRIKNDLLDNFDGIESES
jgi:hypothetical protein